MSDIEINFDVRLGAGDGEPDSTSPHTKAVRTSRQPTSALAGWAAPTPAGFFARTFAAFSMRPRQSMDARNSELKTVATSMAFAARSKALSSFAGAAATAAAQRRRSFVSASTTLDLADSRREAWPTTYHKSGYHDPQYSDLGTAR